jgi:hypothetical protein
MMAGFTMLTQYWAGNMNHDEQAIFADNGHSGR